MFILLRTVEPENGFINRKKQKKALKNSCAVSVPTENGLPFFMLDVFSGKKGLDYPSLEEKCGKYASRIVASRKINLPDKTNLKRFLPGFSNGIFIFNTALEMIRNAEENPEKISVTVIDRNAVMCGKINSLLPLASSVRVVTSRPDRYATICNGIYQEHGASVIVRASYEPSSKKDIVICCDGATNEVMNEAAVFSFKRGVYGKIRFFGSEIPLIPAHREIVPDSIRSTDFAAAITELCASTAYKSSFYSDTETNCTSNCGVNPSVCLRCYISGFLNT